MGGAVKGGGGAGRELELRRQGWTRRFVAAPPRLQEAVELYRSLGLEVRLEPLGPEELAEQCGGCAAATSLFRAIYTRPTARHGSGDAEEEVTVHEEERRGDARRKAARRRGRRP